MVLVEVEGSLGPDGVGGSSGDGVTGDSALPHPARSMPQESKPKVSSLKGFIVLLPVCSILNEKGKNE
jgi:hypothetical protein